MAELRRGLSRWLQDTGEARAVYGVLVDVVAGESIARLDEDRLKAVPLATWDRVLALEGCGAWLDIARRRSPPAAAALEPAASLLGTASARALRNAMVAVRQAEEIAVVAAGAGLRVMALKGLARLLSGESPESRGMADVDVLAAGGDADRLHRALQAQLGYTTHVPGTPDRHLPSLVRPGSLPVEVHRRLTDDGAAIESRVWAGSRSIPVGAAHIEIPDATALLMHALDHALVVHSAARFRLRDVLDVATLGGNCVDRAEFTSYVHGHPERRSAETLLVAASSLQSSVHPTADPDLRRRAWRRIRRVGRARLFAPVRSDLPAALDPRVLVLSQLAQASPRGILRLIVRGVVSPGRAIGLVSGGWLPVEAEQTRTAVGGNPPDERRP